MSVKKENKSRIEDRQFKRLKFIMDKVSKPRVRSKREEKEKENYLINAQLNTEPKNILNQLRLPIHRLWRVFICSIFFLR